MTAGPGSRNYADLRSPEVTSRLSRTTAVWPIGAIEQHGPHLPLSVDLVLAEAIATVLADRLDGICLPAVPIGARSLPQSGGGPTFPGTLHVSGGTLIDYLTETLRSMLRLPFQRLIVVNGHFENEPFLFEAIDQLRESGALNGREVVAFSWWSLVDDDWLTDRGFVTVGWHAEHAGLTETALMLHLRPDLVHEELPRNDTPPRAGVYLHPCDADRISNGGSLSSATGASPELGSDLFKHIVESAVDTIHTKYNRP